MCGFVGFYHNEVCKTPDEIERCRAVCDAMGERIKHRGPDSSGVFADETLALGFRRLSIIDLDGGTQPMHSADGRYIIVFNGEIYNYRELREQLTREFGDTFATASDTETIMSIYSHFGEKTASMLRGMFAFVIYDTYYKTLYGARDWFGIKPFYYTEQDGSFIFASEIKAFLAHPSFKKEINPDALKMYLEFQYSPMSETIFRGTFKLAPGTYFTYSGDGLKKTTYFTPTLAPEKMTKRQAVRRIDEAVCSSVDYHQIADVEVGSFLSGGVDSSYVASTVKPMKTYSVGFSIDGFDETSLAAELCEKLHMPNKKREITPDEFFAALPAVQYHSDEPHANLSAVPLYFLAETAAAELKVVLSGEGADELFGGYDWYIQSGASKAYKRLPADMRRGIAKSLGKLAGKLGARHISQFFINNAQSIEDSYIGQAFIMNDSEAKRLLTEKYKSAMSFRDVTNPLYKRMKYRDELSKKLELDMNLWLPGDILLKADKMTMAHSLELRVPYLDREVWRVARALPSKYKMRGRKTKTAFREAARGHIPPDAARRKKAGFMVPFRVWIKEERFGDMIRKAFKSEWAAEFFDTEYLMKLLDEHIAGRANNARVIYTVYSFLLWYEQFFICR